MTSAHTGKGKTMIDKEFIAVFHYDDGGSNRCGTEPYRYAEEIVRCRECKWSKANGTYQWCGRLDSTARITADDFCSYGEVSEIPTDSEATTDCRQMEGKNK